MTFSHASHTTTAPEQATLVTTAKAIVRLQHELAGAAASRQHQLSELSHANDDQVVVVQREALVQTLAEISSALRRIEEGSFGACTSCNEPIPLERLEFRPWSATCVTCAQR